MVPMPPTASGMVSRSWLRTRWDSVPGMVKLLLSVPEKATAELPTATMTASQAETTHQRRR